MKFSGHGSWQQRIERISSEVYKRVGFIEAGASKKVFMTFNTWRQHHEGFIP